MVLRDAPHFLTEDSAMVKWAVPVKSCRADDVISVPQLAVTKGRGKEGMAVGNTGNTQEP